MKLYASPLTIVCSFTEKLFCTILINIDFKILVHIGIFFITSACSRDFQMYVNVLHIGKENSHIDSFQYYYNNIIA